MLMSYINKINVVKNISGNCRPVLSALLHLTERVKARLRDRSAKKARNERQKCLVIINNNCDINTLRSVKNVSEIFSVHPARHRKLCVPPLEPVSPWENGTGKEPRKKREIFAKKARNQRELFRPNEILLNQFNELHVLKIFPQDTLSRPSWPCPPAISAAAKSGKKVGKKWKMGGKNPAAGWERRTYPAAHCRHPSELSAGP
jgi:hypothetical protein